MKNVVDMITLPEETIIRKIYWIRENKVMLDFDLAALYGVSTKVLKQAVKRNNKMVLTPGQALDPGSGTSPGEYDLGIPNRFALGISST